MRENCYAAGRGERAEDPQRRDRNERAAKSPPADPEAAVEEDDDQRDRRHLDDGLRPDVEAREEVRGDSRDEEE